jgi:hypothetical protein
MRQMRSRELRVDGRLLLPGRRAGRHGALSSRCLFAILWGFACAIVVAVAGAFMLVLDAGSAYRPFTYSAVSKS